MSTLRFYDFDFCSFGCVAVNTVDKLQFLSFIFAVLLSITVHFIALRLGRAIMHQHTKTMLNYGANVFEISIFQTAICHHVEFLKGKILFEEKVWGTSPCQILSKLTY